MSKFQIIVISVFVICIIGGVIAFATFRGSNEQNQLPSITVWGTYSKDLFDQYVNKINTNRSEGLKILYTQIAENNFDKTFIEALARGQGPDAILISQNLLYKHEDKIIPIPYAALTQRTFQDTFIRQADLYLGSSGILALPFTIDPLVMYWNKDTFTNAGIALYPKYWEDFYDLNTKITQKDVNSNIRKSALALGEFNNIVHAKEILGSIFMQNGNPITYRNNTGLISSALGNRTVRGLDTSVPALSFFNQFSNPSNKNYSWNRSLPNSKSSFLSGTLATYFGFASELFDIKNKNSNINFDIAPFPQAKNATNRIVYGNMYGFSIVRSTKDVNSTFSVINALLDPNSLVDLVNLSYLPPVRRDIINMKTTDPYLSIFYDSALISKSWLENDRLESDKIFKNIVESVTSGRKTANDALQQGSDEWDIILNQ